ncbi:uncharacterized protein LOC115210846 [Argonauta hians]
MVGCSAPNCSNRAAKGGYKMKRFPADPAISQIWINNVKRADWNWNPPANFRNCRLCEVHFDDSQFEYKHTSEGTSRCLKPGAIPTLFDIQLGTVCRPHTPSLHSGKSRCHKKIVGEFNPMLCLSNLEQRNQPLTGLSKHTSISTDIFSTTSTQNIINMNYFKKNQTEESISSLPITSCIDEQTDFSQFSNPIHYNKNPQTSSSSDSSLFFPKRIESKHQITVPSSTKEITSLLPISSHQLLPAESNVNLQPLLQPGEIKVEYVEDPPDCDTDSGQQIKPAFSRISSHKKYNTISNETIQNPSEQEQIDSSMMFQPNHWGNISTMISVDMEELRNYSDNSALGKYSEIVCNSSKSEENVHLERLSKKSINMKDNSKSTKSYISQNITPNSHPIYKKALQYSSQSNITKTETLISESPVISDTITNETKPKHSYYFHLSNDTRLQTSPELSENINIKDLESHKLITGTESLETNESFNDNFGGEPYYTHVSESGMKVTNLHERISPNIMQKKDKQLPKNRFTHKFLSMEHLHRKLKEEKRKCLKLRLENQKLRKQLSPLWNLQNWINRLANIDKNSQFGGLNFQEDSTDTLQKALKFCSTVCGYLSNVVNLPFYSNITRSI